MDLDTFIKQLSNEQSFVAEKQFDKSYSLVLEDDLIVDLTSDKGNLVFISVAPSFSSENVEYVDQLKQAMSWALAWNSQLIGLAKIHNQLVVQSIIADDLSFIEVRQALNTHCQFLAKLAQHTIPTDKRAYQYDIIRP